MKLIDIPELDHLFTEASNDFAHTKAEYNRLEDMEKAMLAEISCSLRDSGDASSQSEAESRARASSRYKQFLAEKADARLAYLLADGKKSKLTVLWEARRSNLALERTLAGMV